MRYFAIALLLLCWSCKTENKTSENKELAGNMYTALLNSNTETAMQLVQQLYEKNGVLFGDVEWVYKEPTQVYNYYDAFGPRVILGRMPKPGKETQEYWINWRKVLTNDGWDAQQFFKDEAEMQLMANYNIVVLIAHELGHYFQDYYDVTVAMPGDNVNGRELFADRFSIALTNELANADPRFAKLKQRYLELVQSMNATVPDSNRYSKEQGRLLVAYPDSIRVDQPSFDDPKTMQPYASAFFERHRVLLSGEIALPTLKQITDSVLWKNHYQTIAERPNLVAKFDTTRKGEWKGGHFQEMQMFVFAKGWAGRGEQYGPRKIYTVDTFSILRMNGAGKTWNVSVQEKEIGKDKFQLRYVYKAGDGVEEELPGDWGHAFHVFPEHLFIKSDTDFFLVLYVMNELPTYHAIHYQKQNGKWTMNEIPLATDHPFNKGVYSDNDVTSCVTEDGRFVTVVNKRQADGRYAMELYELDKNNLQPGAPQSLGISSYIGYPDGMAMAADGRIYISAGHYIHTYKNGKWNILLGHGISRTDPLHTDPSRIGFEDAGVMAGTGNSLLFIANWRGRWYLSRGEFWQLRW